MKTLPLHRHRRSWIRSAARVGKWIATASLAACGAFPVNLYVPDETVDALRGSDYVEDLSSERLLDGLKKHLGRLPPPAKPATRRLHRLALSRNAATLHGPLKARRFADADAPWTRDLRAGDMLFAANEKPQSFGQTLSLREFTYYDHMGVLAVEEGELYVYESWPRLSLWKPAADFASRFRGGVRRVSLPSFLSRYETTRFVRLPDASTAGDLAEEARRSLELDIEYDSHHDPDNPALSCSEYVTFLLEHATGRRPDLRRREVTRNPSLLALIGSLGFHTPAYFVPESFAELPGTRTVALVSRFPTLAAFEGKRCAYEVLHEHFTPTERIASYLAIAPLRLVRFRRNIAAFVAWSVRISESHRGTREELGPVLRGVLPLFLKPARRSRGPE